jgi:hypothetical protein
MLGSSLNFITKHFGVATTLESPPPNLIAIHCDRSWAQADPVPGGQDGELG